VALDEPARDSLQVAGSELTEIGTDAPDNGAAPATAATAESGKVDRGGRAAHHRPVRAALGRGGIAGAAALIAVLTVVSRIAGVARTVVFTRATGVTHLASVYLAANTVPNIIFEIVAGGALAALVVPLLAGHIARGDRAATGRTAAALLCWVLVILVPLAVVLALAAHPVMWALSHNSSADELAVGTRMLRIFAPQLPLYGVGIVLTGVLQAHHRFAWPVLAPLLSSVTVIGAYTVFAVVEPAGVDIPGVSLSGQLILSVGTTLAVAVLTLCLVIPVRRLGLTWRPGLRFEPGAARRVRGLAGVGVLTVAAQQISVLAALVVVQWGTVKESLVLFNQAQTVYLLPWAVLAVPLATSSYPVLARAHAQRDEPLFGTTLARTGRSLLALCGLGAGALVAVAAPTAHLLAAIARGQVPANLVDTLTATIIAFAPGLFGYGLFALYSRALYARGENRMAARATLIGWGAVTVLSVLLALALPAKDRVPAVAAANSAGMVLLGAVLIVQVRARAGAAAVAGLGRMLLVSVFAGTVAAVAGLAARWPLSATPGFGGSLLQGMLSGAVAVAGFFAVAGWLARDQVGPPLRRLTGKARTALAGATGRTPRSREEDG
jgi:putative peptidoglycan lipid II flippase